VKTRCRSTAWKGKGKKSPCSWRRRTSINLRNGSPKAPAGDVLSLSPHESPGTGEATRPRRSRRSSRPPTWWRHQLWIPLCFVVAISLCLPIGPAPSGAPTLAGCGHRSILDVGQGDAILVRSPREKRPDRRGSIFRIVSSLNTRRQLARPRRRQHHHADHYGGMDDVIRAFHLGFSGSSSHTRANPTETAPTRAATGASRRSAIAGASKN